MFDQINNNKIYTIAEMSANHAGSLSNALEIVRTAHEAGADCVKIQTYTADTMTIDCDNDYFKIKGGMWDGYKLYDLYKEASLPWKWQQAVKDEADRVGIDFLSTPFDKTSVDFLDDLGVGAYKIASFEITDIPLLRYTAQKQKPILLSTGMASIQEIEQAIAAIKECGNEKIVLLKCTSEYPASYENMNLAVIPDMIQRFGLPVGLSDHSMGSFADVAAVALGAKLIEKHFCLNRKIKNPDSEFSMQPHEFAHMVKDVNNAAKLRGEVTYEHNELELANKAFRRSIFAVSDIAQGEVFTSSNIRVIRPSFGLAPVFYEEIIGKVCKKSIKRGMPLSEAEVEI
ncbi:MAG: pseudaminic acid synthase [Christensenellaceae bacterium]